MSNNKPGLLFLDNSFIAHSRDTVRVFHSWEKDPENPVITKKYDWEGIGPYSPSVFRDDNGVYGCFMGTYGGKKSDYPAGMMTSADGLNWSRRPEMTDAIDDGAQCCACMYDSGHNFGDYKFLGAAVYREKNGLPFRIGFKRSSDGLHWENFGGNPCRVLASDVLFPMWDPIKNNYVMYYKLWKLAGTTLDGSDFCAYFPAFTPTIGRDTFRARGLSVLPEKKYIDVTLKLKGGSLDDGGGGIANESVTMIRVIARAQSDNFIDWYDEKVIIEPPEGAPAGDQTYGMNVSVYAGMYIAQLNHFNSVNGRIRTLLAWSRDGENFNINRGGFALDCGGSGSWDAGMVLPSVFLEDVAGRMCLYYGAQDRDHRETDMDIVRGNTGRAFLRRDGFASLKGGAVTTVPFDITKRLTLNMKGELRIKLHADGICAEGPARGDGISIVPNISLEPFYGKRVTAELMLPHGELFAIRT